MSSHPVRPCACRGDLSRQLNPAGRLGWTQNERVIVCGGMLTHRIIALSMSALVASLLYMYELRHLNVTRKTSSCTTSRQGRKKEFLLSMPAPRTDGLAETFWRPRRENR